MASEYPWSHLLTEKEQEADDKERQEQMLLQLQAQVFSANKKAEQVTAMAEKQFDELSQKLAAADEKLTAVEAQRVATEAQRQATRVELTELRAQLIKEAAKKTEVAKAAAEEEKKKSELMEKLEQQLVEAHDAELIFWIVLESVAAANSESQEHQEKAVLSGTLVWLNKRKKLLEYLRQNNLFESTYPQLERLLFTDKEKLLKFIRTYSAPRIAAHHKD